MRYDIFPSLFWLSAFIFWSRNKWDCPLQQMWGSEPEHIIFKPIDTHKVYVKDFFDKDVLFGRYIPLRDFHRPLKKQWQVFRSDRCLFWKCWKSKDICSEWDAVQNPYFLFIGLVWADLQILCTSNLKWNGKRIQRRFQ